MGSGTYAMKDIVGWLSRAEVTLGVKVVRCEDPGVLWLDELSDVNPLPLGE